MTETGRNDPCPCGSGKKYKKCCGLAKSSPKKIEATVISSGLRSNFFTDRFATVTEENKDLETRAEEKKAKKAAELDQKIIEDSKNDS